MHNDLLGAIDTFYDCVGDAYDRDRALQTFSGVTDESGVFLADIMSDPQEFLSFDFHNIPEDAIKVASTAFGQPEDNLILRLYPILPRGVPTLGRTFCSDEDYQKTPMYQRASKPWGLHGEGVCVLSRGDASGRVCGFVRHQNQQELDAEMLSVVAIAGGHMERAMSLQQRVNRLEEILIQSSSVLDLIEFGLILYGSDRTLHHVNASARRILDAQDGVRLQKNEVALADREAQDQLSFLLDAIYRPERSLSQQSGGIVVAQRPSRQMPYSLMVVPMRSRRAETEATTAAVFLFDPMAQTTTAIELFVSSYGLTRSEAELAHSLALGNSLDEIATKRGVSRNTVKSQLHSIFSKTETSRQSELVSLLLRSVAGISLNAE